MLILRDAVIRYPRFTLGPINLHVGAGERLALLGRNGAGKSTMLALMAGQRQLDSGQVVPTPDTEGVDAATARLAIRRRVAYVGATLYALPWYTVRKHFALLSRFHERWDGARALELARTLRLDLDAAIGTLSRGNLVKLNLCAGWAQQADLLLLDEPTAGLDPVARADMLSELRMFVNEHTGAAIVYATHLLDELSSFEPTRLLVLTDGDMREHDGDATNGFDVDTVTRLMSHHAPLPRSATSLAAI